MGEAVVKKTKSFWKWLDGKKTAIGTAMLIASEFVKPYTVAYQILTIGGVLLGGSGIGHKLVKGDFKKK
jgi:hypothetical protein